MCAAQSLVTFELPLLGGSFGVKPVEFDALVPFLDGRRVRFYIVIVKNDF